MGVQLLPVLEQQLMREGGGAGAGAGSGRLGVGGGSGNLGLRLSSGNLPAGGECGQGTGRHPLCHSRI